MLSFCVKMSTVGVAHFVAFVVMYGGRLKGLSPAFDFDDVVLLLPAMLAPGVTVGWHGFSRVFWNRACTWRRFTGRRRGVLGVLRGADLLAEALVSLPCGKHRPGRALENQCHPAVAGGTEDRFAPRK